MNYYLDFDTMYSFRYNPITKGQIPIYDYTPLIFVLDIQPHTILGVNIHWMPKKYRQEFINKVEDIIENTLGLAKRRQRQILTYKLLKDPKFKPALEGVRRYYRHRMTKVKMISQYEWEIVLGLKKYRARFAKKKDNYKV